MNRRFNMLPAQLNSRFLLRKLWLIPAMLLLAASNAGAQSRPASVSPLTPASSMPAGTQTSSGTRVPSGPPEIHTLSAKEAIDYAAKNNVSVMNALLDYKIQQQSNRAITSQALPQINGSAGVTDNLQIPTTLIPGEFIQQPGTFVPLKFGLQYNTNFGVTLKQILFDGQVFVGLQARQASLDFYQKSQEVTEQAIRANVYKIYY